MSGLWHTAAVVAGCWGASSILVTAIFAMVKHPEPEPTPTPIETLIEAHAIVRAIEAKNDDAWYGAGGSRS